VVDDGNEEMKVVLTTLVIVLHALRSLAVFTGGSSSSGRSLRSTPHKKSLIESHKKSLIEKHRQHEHEDGEKLIPRVAKKQWAHNRHRQRMHMLAREHAVMEREEPVEGCLACFGVQVAYGKYQSEDGDQTDNSFYLFKDPAHKKGDEALPIIIHFHHGSFFSGEPWRTENSEIKSYLSKGFAVVSVGYRQVTEKYFYESADGENRTEELIHVDKNGNLSLDVTGKTMDDYKVRIGKQEFITKYLYDATQMIENLIENADRFGLDVGRIVFAGESTGGAGMQYLTWVYHQWNVGRYTPVGMVYQNAQLNYPVQNMLDGAWDLFVETMGPDVKLSDVVSQEACPVVIGNHICGSPLGESSDYELCNHVWNKKALKRFCGAALASATLGEVKKQHKWPKTDKDVGMEKLWYSSENMQKHLPHDPFYIYVANSMNGTAAVDVAHHSIFALNFAKYAEMNKQGGIQYTAYYTDFAHMTEADRGMERVEVTRAPGDLGLATGLVLPPAAIPSAPPAKEEPVVVMAGGPGSAPGPGPAAFAGPAPGPAPAPAPAPAVEKKAGTTVFNYLSTHNWREDFAGKEVEAGSMEERVLYACLAAGAGPYKEFQVPPNKTKVEEKESASPRGSLPSLSLALLAVVALLRVGQ